MLAILLARSVLFKNTHTRRVTPQRPLPPPPKTEGERRSGTVRSNPGRSRGQQQHRLQRWLLLRHGGGGRLGDGVSELLGRASGLWWGGSGSACSNTELHIYAQRQGHVNTSVFVSTLQLMFGRPEKPDGRSVARPLCRPASKRGGFTTYELM